MIGERHRVMAHYRSYQSEMGILATTGAPSIPLPVMTQQMQMYRLLVSNSFKVHVNIFLNDLQYFNKNVLFVELPYPPIITGIALNSESNRAVDIRFIAGFDGNSPITKYVVEYRLIARESKLNA